MIGIGALMLVIGLIGRKGKYDRQDYKIEKDNPRFVKSKSLYKSKRAMESYEHFYFAQRVTEKSFILVGSIYIIVGIFLYFAGLHINNIFRFIFSILALVGILAFTEYKLHTKNE